jgi:hypothetical protein
VEIVLLPFAGDRFRWAVVLNRRAGRRTSFTFPRRAAYEITFSGRVKRGGRRVSFGVPFAIRAG